MAVPVPHHTIVVTGVGDVMVAGGPLTIVLYTVSRELKTDAVIVVDHNHTPKYTHY